MKKFIIYFCFIFAVSTILILAFICWPSLTLVAYIVGVFALLAIPRKEAHKYLDMFYNLVEED